MKTVGTLLCILSGWLLYEAWPAGVEFGTVLRPAAISGFVAGLVVFANGLKRDVIDALQKGDFEPAHDPPRRRTGRDATRDA
jgi:hypothetical protein